MLTLPLNEPVPLATRFVVPKLPTFAFPETLKVVNVPTLVMLACAFPVTVPAVLALSALTACVAFATVPVTFAPARLDNPEPLPVNTPVLAVNALAVTVPTTSNDVSVPTLVMLDCAAFVTVFAVLACVAFATVPLTLAP